MPRQTLASSNDMATTQPYLPPSQVPQWPSNVPMTSKGKESGGGKQRVPISTLYSTKIPLISRQELRYFLSFRVREVSRAVKIITHYTCQRASTLAQALVTVQCRASQQVSHLPLASGPLRRLFYHRTLPELPSESWSPNLSQSHTIS